MLRLVMAKDAGYLELQRSELRHHAASHAQDCSKKLKYEQMVAIRDAVVTAPQLSAAILRRNMEMHEKSHQDNSGRAHAQLPASGLPCPQKVV